MLLIDEIDRADDGFEAFLLELLSDFQVTIPELGTIRADTSAARVLTSNRTREIGDALRRRCLYLYIEHPTLEKEVRIIRTAVPEAQRAAGRRSRPLRAGAATRGGSRRRPGVAETIDWTQALLSLHSDHSTATRDADAGLPSQGPPRPASALDGRSRPWRSVVPRGVGVTMTADLVAASGAVRRTRCATAASACGVGDEADAARGAHARRSADRDEVRVALRIAAQDPARATGETFDELFAGLATAAESRLVRPRACRPGRPRVAPASPSAPGTARLAARMPRRPPRRPLTADQPGYSPRCCCAASRSTSVSDADLAAMERLLARAGPPAGHAPQPPAGADAGSRLRRPAAQLPAGPRHRRRAGLAGAPDAAPIEEPRLVVLVRHQRLDGRHTRFLLTFVLALRRVARRTEVFAFNTVARRELTPWLSPRKSRTGHARPPGRRRARLVGRHADRRVPGRLRRPILSPRS